MKFCLPMHYLTTMWCEYLVGKLVSEPTCKATDQSSNPLQSIRQLLCIWYHSTHRYKIILDRPKTESAMVMIQLVAFALLMRWGSRGNDILS